MSQGSAELGRAPDPDQIGPYRLIARLGQGGIGAVYRAIRVDGRSAVALKTVRAVSPGALASLRREIQALHGLDHPGIARILEHGSAGGVPWLACELVEGPTLAAVLAELWATAQPGAGGATITVSGLAETAPARGGGAGELAAHAPAVRTGIAAGAGALARLLGLAARLAGSLAVLHRHGVVHGDVTPRNVVVRGGDEPVLIDFGLSLRTRAGGREVLDLPLRAGTPRYMAPEQIRGEVIDARADLHALGAILFEAITGRPPFAVARGGDALDAVLHDTPPPPSLLVDGVPPQLDALVLALLSKQPRRRPGYADDVAAALAGLAGTGDGAPALTIPYLYRPGLVGRAPLLDAIEARLAAAPAGVSLWCLRGESGAGKTRLLGELAARALRAGVQVVVGHGAAGEPRDGRDGVLHALRPLLAAIADRGDELARRDDQLVAHLGVLAVHEPALAALPAVAALPAPPRLDAEGTRHRLLAALRAALARLAGAGPLLLLIDDLQLADELSLAFVRLIATAELRSAAPVVVLAALRVEDAGDAARAVAALAGAQWQVDRLEPDEVGALAAEMLALPAAPPALFAELHAHSEGNPLFVMEYLRAACEEGRLRRAGDGSWHPLTRSGAETIRELPASLRQIIAGRFDRLPPAARRVAEVMAALGRTADEDLLGAAAGSGDDDVAAATAVLVQRGFVTELGAGELGWTHDKLREVAYAAVPEPERGRLHRRIAELLELRSSEDQDGEASAKRAQRSCEDQDGEASAKRAQRSCEDQDGEASAKRAQRSCEDQDGEASAKRAQRSCEDQDGQASAKRAPRPHHAAALAHHFALAGERRRARHYWDSAGELAVSAGSSGDALVFLASAAALDDGVGDVVARARRGRWRAEAAFDQSDFAASERYARDALRELGWAVPEATDRAGWLRRCAREIGVQLIHLAISPRRWIADDDRSRYTEATQLAVRLAHAYRFRTDPLPGVAAALLGGNLADRADDSAGSRGLALLGVLAGAIGARPLAERYLARARSAAIASGDPFARLSTISAEVAYRFGRGEWARTFELLDDGAALAGAVGYQFVHEMMHNLRASALLITGRGDQARALWTATVAQAQTRNGVLMQAWCRLGLAAEALDRDDLATAEPALASARSALASGVELVSHANCETLTALLHSKRGDLAAAMVAAEEALRLLQRGGTPMNFGAYLSSTRLLTVVLGAWQQARARGDDDARLAAAARHACAQARRYGRMFRIGRPAALLARGWYAALLGERRRARGWLRRGLADADQLGLAHERAQLRRALARLDARPGAAGTTEETR